MRIKFGITFLFLLIAPFVFSYELILKNGKTIQGTFVSEDEEKISIKDKDGVTLNFKKTLIDQEKTAEANKPAPEPEKAAEPEKPAEPKEPAKPKKPARVYDSNDLYRLRSEYPMESGAGVQFEEGEKVSAPKGRSGEEWQALTQDLLAQIKAAEQDYQQLSAKCKEFQGTTIQTHIAVTPEGKQTDLAQAKEQVCQQAEDAKGALESAKQEYASAVEEAKQQNVLPGYIATE